MPRPTRASPSAPRVDRRAAILESALQLFAERGFHGTAVPLVAQRARVGAGTVYRYFPSKEVLVNELFRQWKERVRHALLDRFPSESPIRQQFHELWRRLVYFAKDHPEAFQFLELHHHAGYLDERSRSVDAAVLAPTLEMVVRAQADMAIREASPEVLMAMVFGAVVGLFRAHQRGFPTMSEEAILAAEECLWEAIRR